MRRGLLILPILLLVALIWWLAAGGDRALAEWAACWQRGFQTQLAGILRALRAGEPGATGLLLAACFGYGFFHALGPGHGKVLIGGYGLGRQVPFLRLSLISTLAALGQALVAMVLVLAGLWLLDLSRAQMTDAAERMMLPVSALAVALIGGWLALRGLWQLRAEKTAADHHHHHHRDYHHDTACGCGHRHGPSPEDLSAAGGLRETLALIVSIAIRPCSGAILLLVLTWHMGILPAGILGVVAMSLGTAALTVLVSGISVFARQSTALSLGDGATARLVFPLIQLCAGLGIAILSLGLLKGF